MLTNPTIQMKLHIIITSQHNASRLHSLFYRGCGGIYFTISEISIAFCNATRKRLFSRTLACFSAQPGRSDFPRFLRRGTTTILANTSEGCKIKTEENAQRNAASSFVSPFYWAPNVENYLAAQTPFLLVAALDHLSPMWFATKKKKTQLFFFPFRLHSSKRLHAIKLVSLKCSEIPHILPVAIVTFQCIVY